MTQMPTNAARSAALGAQSQDHFSDSAAALLAAAKRLLPRLQAGQPVDAAALREAMNQAFGGSDAQGAWVWKSAYDACEAALVLFMRKYGAALVRRDPVAALPLLEQMAALLPTHTRRSEAGQALQQFSTPLGLAFVAASAAGVTASDHVLEPSAGTGLLAVYPWLSRAGVSLNEYAEIRAELLARLFPGVRVWGHDAASIDDRLTPSVRPTVVLMNPPFSAVAHVDRTMRDAALRHIASALARLEPGGRLVVITSAACSPHHAAWRASFEGMQRVGRVVFTASIDGRVYARHGTSIDTRLTVIDKLPAENPEHFPADAGHAPDTATLLGWVLGLVPPRPPLESAPVPVGLPAAAGERPSLARRSAMVVPLRTRTAAPLVSAGAGSGRTPPVADGPVGETSYEPVAWVPPTDRLNEGIYEPYHLQSLRIAGAKPHPTPLVQSSAMASVAPPQPSYKPHLPVRLIEEGILSDAQIESVIYAGEAHQGYLSGRWIVDETGDILSAAADDDPAAVSFRRGWFLGDGTGAGKGRQVAGIILDNWLKGRRRAVWISVSDRLLEDAQRDWAALGQERLLVSPLSRFRQGTPIRLEEGILFTTYATLRSQERGEKASRVAQIVEWLGADFDGLIFFDEAHAMANAAGGKGERGEVAASQQGRAGLRLQHVLPDARIVYVSATGATTVQNLAYAQRLGLWGGEDFPFGNRAEFITAIENGGVAAMEVLARDLKALGLYAARSLSFDGVEYEMLQHDLTEEQVRIYDAYAGAFEVIHNNLAAAMEAAGITSPKHGTLNRQAKSAAHSAFEQAKQRFFNHLITAMQTPSVITSIERDLAAGHAAVIQIVSTGEALLERRLADIPTEEWNDISVDITPREYVLDYLAHSFPVQLYEPFTDEAGTLSSRPARDAKGNVVLNREAVRCRDAMIERLAALPPVPGALDQIIQHFGTENVAEVTGRKRRIVPKANADGSTRMAVENRPASAGLHETDAFQDDVKQILIFSDAGGTGRSYHADLGARNQRHRIHYLLEAGWKADAAIQGFGRTNRTNQKQAPLFRPVSTDVKAQKRFISTIARRLDTLGAITRGQRQTGGQNMFRPEDNLESWYARDALTQFYRLIAHGKLAGCSLGRFEAATGLSLLDAEGSMRDELPGISTFLNRMLALTIELQGVLFAAFEGLLTARIEGAIASGTYEVGLETLSAESFCVSDRRVIYTHPGTGAQTHLLTIARKDRIKPVSLADALAMVKVGGKLLVHGETGLAAVRRRARSVMDDEGAMIPRVKLIFPLSERVMYADFFMSGAWQEADEAAFSEAWRRELAGLPEFETSQIHMVAGLLLPIWRRLPDDSTRIYRLQSDEGERIIGRRVSAAWAASVANDGGPVTLTAEQAMSMLMPGEAALHLAEGQTLKRVRAMNDWRIELLCFNDLGVERLKTMGLISEIVSWKLRLYVPVGGVGMTVLEKLLERFPVERIEQLRAA